VLTMILYHSSTEALSVNYDPLSLEEALSVNYDPLSLEKALSVNYDPLSLDHRGIKC